VFKNIRPTTQMEGVALGYERFAKTSQRTNIDDNKDPRDQAVTRGAVGEKKKVSNT